MPLGPILAVHLNAAVIVATTTECEETDLAGS